jgi:hypothetical protein
MVSPEYVVCSLKFLAPNASLEGFHVVLQRSCQVAKSFTSVERDVCQGIYLS